MTSRERLMAVLKGDVTDRVPWAPEINETFAKRILGKQCQGDALTDADFVTMHKLIGADFFASGEFVKITYSKGVTNHTQEQGSEIKEIIGTPKGELVKRARWDEYAKTTYTTEYFIKSPDDYKIFSFFMDNISYSLDIEGLEKQRDTINENGIVALLGPQTPYMRCVMDLVGIEKTIFQLFDHEREFTALMETMHRKQKEYYEALSASPIGDVISTYEDTSSRLSSPRTFEKFSGRHLKDYADIAHKGRKHFIPHMCGHLKDLLPYFKDIGLDGIEAVTPPPTGDCTPKMLRDYLGSKMIIIGGFDPTQYVVSTPAKIEKMVSELLESMSGDRRFILGHEEIPPAAKWENVMKVSKIIRLSKGE